MAGNFENSAGIGVYNHYGPRNSNVEDAGVIKTEGAYNEVTFDVSADDINDIISDGGSRAFDLSLIPAGAKITKVFFNIDTAFSFTGGTTPTIQVGTEGSEATNNVTLANGDIGTGVVEYDHQEDSSQFNGTWASELAADTQIGFALGGTPTSLDAGQARITIRYFKNK